MTDEFTDHYGLQRLTTDDLSKNSFKFSEGDRILEDQLLYLGAEGHRHTGGASANVAITVGPVLTLVNGAGFIPASTRVYYKITYLDTNGIETAASPESYIDTTAAVTSPTGPGLATSTTGGTLSPGPYYYVLSAYQTFNSLETLASDARYVTIPYSTNTNANTLTFPALPSGATGFNIYRKSPSSVSYRYLASVNMAAATPPTTYMDTGAIAETQSRSLPVANTTVTQNSVTVSIAGATPSIPAGYSWRIYRTYVTGDYSNSLLITNTGSTLSYSDIGASTGFGQPPTSGQSVGSPTKILLTNAAEVKGLLPLANVEGTGTGVTSAFGWYNVKSYGALGDGTTDDTAAIQATIVASTAGSTIFFPPGVYRTSAPIELYEQRTYQGAWAPRWPYSTVYTSPHNTTIKGKSTHSGPAIFRLREKTLSGRSLDGNGVRLVNLVADCGAVVAMACGGFKVEGLCKDLEFDHCVSASAKIAHGIWFTQGGGTGYPRGLKMISNVAWDGDYAGFRYENTTDGFFEDNLAISNGKLTSGTPTKGGDYAGYWWSNAGENMVVGDRAVFNNGEGFWIDGTTGVGQMTMIGPATDRNARDGMVITQSGTQPLQIIAPRLRRDGSLVSATPVGFAAIKISGQLGATPTSVVPVEIVSGQSTVGVNDDGSGSDSPQYGIYAFNTQSVQILGGEWWGVSGGLNDGGSNTKLTFEKTTDFYSGAHASKTRQFPDVLQGASETVTLRSGTDTWTSMPLAATEFLGGTTRRIYVDLNGRNFYRWFLGVSVAGTAASTMKIQYTTDLTGAGGWTDLTGTLSCFTPGLILSVSGSVPSAAKGPVLLRPLGAGGDGSTSPVFSGIGIVVRI